MVQGLKLKHKKGVPPPKRGPTPAYDKDNLMASMERYISLQGCNKALDLGIYMHLPLTHAVRGHGLLACQGFIRALLGAVPAGQVLYSAGHLDQETTLCVQQTCCTVIAGLCVCCCGLTQGPEEDVPAFGSEVP